MILRWLNQRDSNNLIGLDIGSDSLKLLKINSKENSCKVEKFLIAPIPSGAIIKNEIKNTSTIGNILKDMVRQSEITTKNVALAIPRASAIIKNIMVDKRLNSDDIESRAWIEAHRHFPDLVGDIYLDFSIVGPSAQDTSQLELILVACRKDQIKPHIEILRQAGLAPKIVDVNTYALERALSIVSQTMPELKTMALLNLDFNLSTLIVSHENKLVYAHDQTFDGRRLMNQVREYNEKKQKQKSSAENENTIKEEPIKEEPIKEEPIKENTVKENQQEISANKIDGTEDDTKYNEILKESLSAHLRHTIHFFYSSRPNINIQRIILSGDCANISQLALFIQREIGIEVVIANPFVNMTLESQVDKEKLKQNAPSLMLCCGLALSELN